MSKKAKTEVDDKSAAIITDAVLAENDKKLKDLSASIQNALKRKHKIIMAASSTPTISYPSFTAV